MTIIDLINSYLQIRRATGYDLRHAASLLASFGRYCLEAGESRIGASTVVAWAALARSPGERSRRLKAVIRFARYAKTIDSQHQIPPDGVFGYLKRRRVPYILSPLEIDKIIEQALRLGPAESLRPHTYATLFSLLAVTGLRVGEVLALRLSDFTADGLVVRNTKFRKTRLVPLHPTTVSGLERYLARRRRVQGRDDCFFVSLRGHGFRYETVRSVFQSLVNAAGITSGAGCRRPGIHSFRHTFAVRALEACPRDRDQIGRHILALSTYLGHAHVADTYWYLEATPQLLTDVLQAWEAYVKGESE
ncbi:MAG: integrase [Acidobacteria bacterium]|nr:MAG: integrase [Acidobacteriota bacterium]